MAETAWLVSVVLVNDRTVVRTATTIDDAERTAIRYHERYKLLATIYINGVRRYGNEDTRRFLRDRYKWPETITSSTNPKAKDGTHRWKENWYADTNDRIVV